MTLLKEEFWGLSFEESRACGMDIPKRLHMRRDILTMNVYHDSRNTIL
jgi:hypothetical protein